MFNKFTLNNYGGNSISSLKYRIINYMSLHKLSTKLSF